MRQLGDAYVQSEFRLHKTAKPEQATLFFVEWENYLQHIERAGREKQSIEMGLVVEPRRHQSQPHQKYQQQHESLISLGTSSSSRMTSLSTSSQQQQHSIMKHNQGSNNDEGGGRTVYFGKDISNDIALSEEQVGKLEQLRDEATKAAADAAVNTNNRGNENGGGGGGSRG